MYVHKFSILLRRCLLYDIQDLLGTDFNRKICSLATKVGAKPLSMLVDQQMSGKASPTPGLIARKVKPSAAYCCAYCTVSMFKAAFEILYAGDGRGRNASAIAMEPKVVDLIFRSAS